MIRNRLASLAFAALTAIAGLAALPAAAAAVDVNRASQAELETVKGIGPGLSGKILAAREKGAFKDWTDLQERVAGIGNRNAAKFSQAGLTVAGDSFGAAQDAPPADPKPARASKTRPQ